MTARSSMACPSLPRNGYHGAIGTRTASVRPPCSRRSSVSTSDGGELTIGETVKISYVDQSRAGTTRHPVECCLGTAWTFIQVGNVEMPSRLASAFGFKGPDQQNKPVSCPVVSDATVRNLVFALKQGGNLLLLDERPTTSTSRRSVRWKTPSWRLSAAPSSRPTDRWFLDRVATILAWEGTGRGAR